MSRWITAFVLALFFGIIDSNRPLLSEDDFLIGYGTAFPEATAYLASSQLYFGRSYSPLLIAADEHVRRGRLSDALHDSIMCLRESPRSFLPVPVGQ